MDNPKIYPNLIHMSENHYRLDIKLENTPSNFLGTAFHLHIKGNDWIYEGYKLGSLFDKPNTIALATQKDIPEKTIIFGVTIKKGFAVKTSQGTLVSFYLKFPKTSKIDVKFNNKIISILEKDRKNIDTSWQNETFDLSNINNNKVISEKNEISKKNEVNTKEILTSTETTEENIAKAVTQAEKQTIPIDPVTSQQNSYNDFFWTITIIISTLLLVGISFLIKHFKKNLKEDTKEKIDLS